MKRLDLGEFRKLTASLPDSTMVVIADGCCETTPVENAVLGILYPGTSIPWSQDRPTEKTNVVTLYRGLLSALRRTPPHPDAKLNAPETGRLRASFALPSGTAGFDFRHSRPRTTK